MALVKKKPVEETAEEAEEIEEIEEEQTETPSAKIVNKKKEKEPVFIIQKEVPKQDVRQVQLEDGNTGIILTLEEGMTEILNRLIKIEKALI